MHHTQTDKALAGALLELIGFLNSPRQDEVLLGEAGVALDRALFPLLVRIGVLGPLGVVELADQVGRDHSTVSRQLAKLESLGLVARAVRSQDRRVRSAGITPAGERVVRAIAEARGRLLGRALADWPDDDRRDLSRLLRRFVDALKMAQTPGPG